MLEPYACRIFPLGFVWHRARFRVTRRCYDRGCPWQNGTLPKETASEGAFQLCRVRPSGVVSTTYRSGACVRMRPTETDLSGRWTAGRS